MISMGKKFKYIKVRGKMISGQYDTSEVDHRAYEAATLVDDAGEELHFRILVVPKRLDEKFSLKEDVIFYMLRHKDNKGQFSGAVYAIEVNGDKVFYPIDGWKAVRILAQGTSARRMLMNNPVVLAVSVVFGGMFFGAIALTISHFVFGAEPLFVGLVAAVFWAYVLLFPLINCKKYAGHEIMMEALRIDGFSAIPTRATTSKY